MKQVRHRFYRQLWRVWIPGGSLALFGGCNALSDAQLTQILQSVISTGINALLTNGIAALLGAASNTTTM